METIYNIIFACLDAALSYITISYLFSAFSLTKRIKFKYLHIIGLCVSIVNTLFINKALLILFITFLCALIYSYGYNIKWYNNLFISFVSVALSALSELIVGIVMMTVFSMPFDNTVTGAAYFIGLILSRFIAYIITYIIKISKHKLFHKDFRKKWLLIFILPIATVLVCGVLFKNISIGQADQSEFVIFIILSLLVASNVFVFYFIDDIYEAIANKEKLNLAQNLIKQQEKQYEELYANSREVRKLRHNHKNFLLGVLNEIEKENYENIKKAFDRELDI